MHRVGAGAIANLNLVEQKLCCWQCWRFRSLFDGIVALSLGLSLFAVSEVNSLSHQELLLLFRDNSGAVQLQVVGSSQ